MGVIMYEILKEGRLMWNSCIMNLTIQRWRQVPGDDKIQLYTGE